MHQSLDGERIYYAENDSATFTVDSGSKFAVFGFTTSQIHLVKDGTEITDRVTHTTGFNETDSTYYIKFFEESHNNTFTVYDPLDVTGAVNRGLNWTVSTNNPDGSFGFGIDERDSASAVYALNMSGKYNLSREIGALDIFESVSERYGFEAAYYENAVRKDSRIIDCILNTQSTDGSWNSNVEDTGFALLTLKSSGNISQAVINAEDSGLSWLKSVQNRDGGFAYAGGGSYPLYTAVAAMTLKEYGAASEYNAAALWLLDHMYPDGGWKYTRDTAYAVTVLAGSGYDLSQPVLFLKDNPGKEPYERAIGIMALSAAGLNTDSMLEELYADRTPVTATWGTMMLEDRIITTSSAMMLFNITGYSDDHNKAAGFLQNASAPTLHSKLYMASALHSDPILAEIISYQNPDGGFGELYHESNVRDSSMAYMALYNSSYTPEKDASAAYIAGKQEVSGAFGTVEETSVAITALVISGNASYSGSIDRGLDYLIYVQDVDGSWNRNNYTTAIALNAIAKAGKEKYESNIIKSVGYLVYVQDMSGSWMKPYPDTLTTIHALIALKETSVSLPPVSIIISNVNASEITDESANIEWTTDKAGDSLVKYGTISGAYTQQERNAANVILHDIKLIGLIPNTTYYYAVNSTDVQGNSAESAEQIFRTHGLTDIIPPTISSITLFPANTTAGSRINITVLASDNTGVVEVSANNTQLTNSGGFWNGSITAPSSIGKYSLLIKAKDAAGNTAEASANYSVVLCQGGASVSVSPRSSNVTNGTSVILNIKVKNTQNVDDVFRVNINVSELPLSYQANLTWFNWTEKLLNIQAGQEITIPISITIPGGVSGTKLFRAKANSMTSKPYAYDTGYLKIS